MRNFLAIGLAGVLILLFFTWVFPARAAIFKYSYAGNAFDEIVSGDLFTTMDRITGHLIVDCGLIPEGEGGGKCSGLTGFPYRYRDAVIDFSFSAGPVTVSSADEDASFEEILFSTSRDSDIISWSVAVRNSLDAPSDGRIYTDYSSLSPLDQATFVDGLTPPIVDIDIARTENAPGTWTTKVVPIPAAIYMLASGLAVLVVWKWRRTHSLS